MKNNYVENYQPYDELQITYDDGKTWEDYYTIRDLVDARGAQAKVDFNRGEEYCFRIVRKTEVVYQ